MFQRNVAIKVAASILFLVCLNAFVLISHAGAHTITGKVVGVADGDTITVLQDRTQYKIWLYGIDTPKSTLIQDIFTTLQQIKHHLCESSCPHWI